MKIGGFEIESDAHHYAHAFARGLQRKTGILKGSGADFEGQQLLGEDIADFVGRNLELAHGQVQLLHVGARRIDAFEAVDHVGVGVFPSVHRALRNGADPLKK